MQIFKSPDEILKWIETRRGSSLFVLTLGAERLDISSKERRRTPTAKMVFDIIIMEVYFCLT
jgi:hypothetical protein